MPTDTAIHDLETLVAPLSVAAFRALLKDRTPQFLPQAGPAGLVGWDELMAAVHGGDVPADALRITRQGRAIPRMFYRDGGRVKIDAIDRVMGEGASLIVDHVERYVPAVGRLCAALAAETGEHLLSTAIATTGEGGAFDLHYDPADLMVLQVDGAKRWIVEADPAIDPLDYKQGAGDRPAAVLIDTVLKPGDRLFLPAGYRHRCETEGGRSLHLSILFYPLTVARALNLIARAAADRPEGRRPVRYAPGGEAAAGEALRARLIAEIAAMPIAELIERHQSESVKKFAGRSEAARAGGGDGGDDAP